MNPFATAIIQPGQRVTAPALCGQEPINGTVLEFVAGEYTVQLDDGRKTVALPEVLLSRWLLLPEWVEFIQPLRLGTYIPKGETQPVIVAFVGEVQISHAARPHDPVHAALLRTGLIPAPMYGYLPEGF